MKNIKKKIIIGIAVATIGIVGILGVTNSKYINQISGNGQTEIAKWYFSVNESTEEMATIKLADTYDESSLINGKIAPGTSGSFDLVIDGTGSEVGIEYNVDFENETNKPSNLKFIYEDQVLEEIEDYEQFLTGVINADDENKIRTLTVYWEWPYETENEDSTIDENDDVDTAEGLNALDYSFDIKVTGKQVIPQST